MKEKKKKEGDTEELWIDFACTLPEKGQKIKIHREMEYEGIWNGEEVAKEKSDKQFEWTITSFWQACD